MPRRQSSNPTPTGLLGFALATLFHSLNHCGAFDDDPSMIGTAICLGAFLQIIAGHYEYVNKNNNVTCIFYAFGFFWLMDGLDSLIGLQSWAPNSDRRAAAWVFGMFAIYAFFCVVISARNKLMIMPVLLFGAFLVFLLSALNTAYDSQALEYVLGAVGICTGTLALYWSLGMMFNEGWGKRIVPFTDHADDYDVLPTTYQVVSNNSR